MINQTYTEDSLKRMRDANLIVLANELGMDTSAFTPPGDEFKEVHKDDVIAFILSKQAPAAPAVKASSLKKGGKVRLVIPTQDGGAGDKPVKVSVNGKMDLIPRDVEVSVPSAVFHVLENAMEEINTWDEKKNEMRTTQRRRFSYTVIGQE